jgi:hypothetical protein
MVRILLKPLVVITVHLRTLRDKWLGKNQGRGKMHLQIDDHFLSALFERVKQFRFSLLQPEAKDQLSTAYWQTKTARRYRLPQGRF